MDKLPPATRDENKWYERERAAFIVWWESEGQKKFSGTTTLAAGASWLARAEAASTASETPMPKPELVFQTEHHLNEVRKHFEWLVKKYSADGVGFRNTNTEAGCIWNDAVNLARGIAGATPSATRGLIRDCAEPSIRRGADKHSTPRTDALQDSWRGGTKMLVAEWAQEALLLCGELEGLLGSANAHLAHQAALLATKDRHLEAIASATAPTEEACKALYEHFGKEAMMKPDEIADLWPEDREDVIADYRAWFKILCGEYVGGKS